MDTANTIVVTNPLPTTITVIIMMQTTRILKLLIKESIMTLIILLTIQ